MNVLSVFLCWFAPLTHFAFCPCLIHNVRVQAEADRKAAAHQAAIDRTLEQKQKRDADLVAKIEREKQEAVGILFFFHFFLLSGGWLNRFCSLLVM